MTYRVILGSISALISMTITLGLDCPKAACGPSPQSMENTIINFFIVTKLINLHKVNSKLA